MVLANSKSIGYTVIDMAKISSSHCGGIRYCSHWPIWLFVKEPCTEVFRVHVH